MKRIFNNYLVLFFALTLAAGPLFYISPAHAAATSTDDGTVTCTQYTLVWTNPDDPAVNPPGTVVAPGTDPLLAVNPVNISSGLEPVVPSSLTGKAEWQCTKTSGTTGELPVGTDSTEGTELCLKAAELSARFGALTSLDHLQSNIQDTVINFLQNQLSSLAHINIKLNAKDLLNKGLVAGGQFLKTEFDTLFGNPLKKEVQDKANAIIADAKKKLQDLAGKYISDLAEKTGDAAKNLIGINTAVPTEPQGKIIENTEVTNQRLSDIIAEQRHQEVVANTRQKCQALYTKANEQIKNALLFQLSNQVVDWIQNGEAPQFIKQPGKFLADTALLAVDRTISQIAPRLCQPFRLAVTVQIPTVNNQTNPFYQQVTCSLDQVVGNIEDFYSDFRNGGWLAYQEIWQPQNNYYGAMMLTRDAVNIQQQAAIQGAQNDLNRGNGFISQTQCTEWILYKPANFSGSVTESVARALELRDGSYFEPDRSSVQGPTDDGKSPAIPSSAPEGSYWQCERGEITSPGTIAQGLSQQATQTTIANINQTSDVEALLGTIEDAILNKLVKLGVGGLKNILKGLPSL